MFVSSDGMCTAVILAMLWSNQDILSIVEQRGGFPRRTGCRSSLIYAAERRQHYDSAPARTQGIHVAATSLWSLLWVIFLCLCAVEALCFGVVHLFVQPSIPFSWV